MSTSSALEIFSTTGKFIAAFGDVPALSALKPIGSILVAICDHVTALRDNEEAAIMVAERVDQAVRVLINHTQDLDGATLGNYRVDIKNFESTLLKISHSLQNLRQRNGLLRFFSPKADASEFNRLCSQLDYTIRIFGLSANFEARKTHRLIQALVPKEENISGCSELHCPTIAPLAIRPLYELNENDIRSVQAAKYNKQAVIVKKYYPTSEKIFARDLKERLNQMHPGIARVIGGNYKATIIVLSAIDLILYTKNPMDVESMRRPWQERRITSSVPSNSPGRTSVLYPRSKILIKESSKLLQQFISVLQFLRRMNVEVAWWEFKPSWVGLQGNSQLVLIDWDQDMKKEDGEFEPQYAIHIIGLGFSDCVAGVFQESGRLLEGDVVDGMGGMQNEPDNVWDFIEEWYLGYIAVAQG